MTGSPRDDVAVVDAVAAEALQDALAAEHAAIWCYTLALAFLPPDQIDQARQDAEAHRELRGAVETTLTDLGERPVSALPAYATPEPVEDAASAAALAVVAETDALAAWRSVMERTEDRALRQAALDAMTDGTLRCARWRVVVGTPPAIPVFPGLP
ncbi:ferritin-like domain-containing protein [Pseudonocardia nigra]|uniref:ferritin-like domain-containing protein n=1 Tax=Pseudonocardia nigra TaxID=1921578 RepID=UPI001C5F52D3|nr:ferritin-like domain-containing protein [Pseudonocardia nigra]